MSRSLSQPERFVVFALNVATFYLLYVWATGHWEVVNEPKSLWFDAAVASWALSLLSAPFFRPPKDAIGAGVAALLVLVATHLQNTQINVFLLDAARHFAIGYALFVIVAAYIAALAETRQQSAIARLSYIAAERLSNGAFLFGLLASISIFGFYEPAEKVFILMLFWLGFFVVKPFELLGTLLNDWRVQRTVLSADAVGQILRIDDPNIVRIQIEKADGWADGLYIASLPGKVHRYVIPLFSQIQDDIIIGTGLITDQSPEGTRPHVIGLVSAFLGKSGAGLGLFELAEVTNTKASLRATELYLSEIMQWARNHRKARRILIVLEEAHTIIPETAGAGFDYDTQWVVSRIGQIALQGRKYGVGLLIVSQRTALVSKTILSQCNTFLTHALIDQTSLNFLGNIYQAHYVSVIPDLRFLQFLAYGKGVRSERPLLLERSFDDEKAQASSFLDEQVDFDKEILDETPPTTTPPPPPGRAGPSVTAL